MTRTAIYAGSFDPVTNGHLDILRRGLDIFDTVVVAVASEVNKGSMFDERERVALIKEAIGDQPRVQVESFRGLLVDYAKQRGAVAVLRGLRAVSDFEFEFQMQSMNRSMAPTIRTVFLMAAEQNFYVSSSLVKEVAMLGGNVSHHVPANVHQALVKRREARA